MKKTLAKALVFQKPPRVDIGMENMKQNVNMYGRRKLCSKPTWVPGEDGKN